MSEENAEAIEETIEQAEEIVGEPVEDENERIEEPAEEPAEEANGNPSDEQAEVQAELFESQSVENAIETGIDILTPAVVAPRGVGSLDSILEASLQAVSASHAALEALSYTAHAWQDDTAEGPWLNAENLNAMDGQIETLTNAVNTLNDNIETVRESVSRHFTWASAGDIAAGGSNYNVQSPAIEVPDGKSVIGVGCQCGAGCIAGSNGYSTTTKSFSASVYNPTTVTRSPVVTWLYFLM